MVQQRRHHLDEGQVHELLGIVAEVNDADKLPSAGTDASARREATEWARLRHPSSWRHPSDGDA